MNGTVHHRTLLAILVLGAVLRLGYAVHLSGGPLFGDAADYLACADNLAAGNGFSLEPATTKRGHVGPIYPLFLAALKLAGVESITAIRLVQAVLGSALILAAYSLGTAVGDRRTGLLAAGLTGIYPYFIHWSGVISTEWLGMILFTLSLALFLHGMRNRKPVLYFAAGLGAGLSALARPPLLLVPFLLAAVLVVLLVRTPGTGLRAGLLLVAGTILALAPWTLRNFLVFDRFIPVALGFGHALFQQAAYSLPIPETEQNDIIEDWFARYYSRPESPRAEMEGQEILAAQAREWIRENPAGYTARVWYNFRRFWSFYPGQLSEHPDSQMRLMGLGSYGLLFPFMILGLLAAAVEARARWLILLVPIAYLTAAHSAVFGMIRYRMPIEPELIVLAAVGLIFLWDRIPERYRTRIAAATAGGQREIAG